MDVVGNVTTLAEGLSYEAVTGVTHNVFSVFGGVLVGAVLLTLTVYFIRKVLNGANKGKARIR